MHNNKKFVAKSTSYSLIKNSDDIDKNNKSIDYSKSETVIDLVGINLQQMLINLKQNINKKPSWFIFLRLRENEKIKITNDKIELLIEQISKMRTLGREFLELKADEIFGPQLLNLLVHDRFLDFKQGVELKISEHKQKLHIIKIDEEKRELELLDIKLEQARKQAEIDLITSKTKQEIELANFIKETVARIKDLPDGAIVSMWHDFINKEKMNTEYSSDRDFDMNEFFKEFRKSKLNEELKQTKAETKEVQSKSNFEQWKNKKKMDGEI